MKTTIYSSQIRSGKTTYYVDVRESKNGNKYLSITQQRFNGKEKERTSIRVFGDAIEEFVKAIEEAARALSQD